MTLEAIQLSCLIIAWNFYGNKKEIIWPTVWVFSLYVDEKECYVRERMFNT